MRELVKIATLLVFFSVSSSLAAPHLPVSVPQYRIKLGPFVVPPARTVGMVVKARINGGPPLRLLLDSGTQYVVLDRKTAMKAGCYGGGELDLVGVGSSAAIVVKTQRAKTLQVGDLTLRDVPVLIENRTLADGIQGALPLAIFSGFLIRLDIPAKNLDLLPYPDQRAGSSGDLQSFSSNHLLFLKGTANGSREGYFLLDTGASYTTISRKLARQLAISESLADRVPLEAGTGAIDAALLRGSLRFQFGSRELPTDEVVAVDLSAASRYHQLEIAGLIGYPALRNFVVMVSYRDNAVRIESR